MAKILIAEDNESLQTLMTMNLEKHYDILLVNNGVEALNVVELSHIDLIIADDYMVKPVTIVVGIVGVGICISTYTQQ